MIEMHRNNQQLLFAPAAVATISLPAPLNGEAQFLRDEQDAIELGRMVARAQGKLDVAWDQVLPTIYKVWSHFSQRGDDHEKGRAREGEVQQDWTGWLDEYYRKTGLHPKKVQRRLKGYRDQLAGVQPQQPAKSKPKRKSMGESAVPDEVVRELVESALLMRESLEAIANGASVYDELTMIKQAAMSAECLKQIFSLLPAGASDAQATDASPVSHFAVRRAAPVLVGTEPSIKAGNVAGLNWLIDDRCGKDFTHCLSSLGEHEAAKSVENIAEHILQCHANRDRSRGHYQVSIVFVPAPPPAKLLHRLGAI